MKREVEALNNVDHPLVIKYIEYFITKDGKVHIVTEFAQQGTLDDILKSEKMRPKSENEILSCFTMILLGLQHIHDKKVIHRDLKPENILVGANGLLKIGDFGVSKVISHTKSNAKTTKAMTTPYFKAPELIKDQPHTTKVDIWAAGVILYLMCTKKYPFEASNNEESALIYKILEQPHPAVENFSPSMKELIDSLLTKDPTKRPSIDEVLEFPKI